MDTTSEKDVRGFAAQAGITYPIYMDKTQKLARQFRITGTPHSVFINRKGVITSVRSGLMTPATIEAELQKALK